MSESERFIQCDIYLCRGCREPFAEGDEVVALTDGIVYPEDKYDVENRRMWHRECFLEDHEQYRSHWKPPAPDEEPLRTDGGASDSERSVCYSCEALGAENGELIPVWEDPEDYERGEDPDYIGCTSCCTMRAVDTDSDGATDT